jgi:hypothetical protein
MDERNDLEVRAHALGYAHGRNVGDWTIDDRTTRQECLKVLRGLRDGDPEISDMMPAPLSGEWADDPTPASVLAELEVDDDDQDGTNELLQAYEEGFAGGWQTRVEFLCRLQLSPNHETNMVWTVVPEDDDEPVTQYRWHGGVTVNVYTGSDSEGWSEVDVWSVCQDTAKRWLREGWGCFSEAMTEHYVEGLVDGD